MVFGRVYAWVDKLRCSHLLFVDDNLFFLKAFTKGVTILERMLQRHAELSSQELNMQKSAITCAHGVNNDLKDHLSSLRNIQAAEITNGKYLCLPYIIGRSKQ